MDVETQKPFACKAKDCGMCFTNEDHLNVHEKKHDMMLNLGLSEKGAGGFIADQTPTPTRLIKNCEDVGLFDDLKHVNPFDETFRRAVEAKCENSDLEAPPSSDNANQPDDSLHTPQVFPQFDPTETAAVGPTTTSDNYDNFVETRQTMFLSESISAEDKKVPKKSRQAKKQASTVTKPTNILPAPMVATRHMIVPATISLVPATQIVALSLPAASLMQQPVLLPKLATSNVSNVQSPVEMSVKDRLKAHLSSPKIRSPTTPPVEEVTRKLSLNSRGLKNIKREPKDIHDDCLERRRAAALRYRRKIKKEQNDLKRKNAELVAENSQLKTLVKQLREELMHSRQSCTLQGNVLIQDAGHSLFRGSRSTPSFQIPIATPVNLFVQNDNLSATMAATVVKIPVPNLD